MTTRSDADNGNSGHTIPVVSQRALPSADRSATTRDTYIRPDVRARIHDNAPLECVRLTVVWLCSFTCLLCGLGYGYICHRHIKQATIDLASANSHLHHWHPRPWQPRGPDDADAPIRLAQNSRVVSQGTKVTTKVSQSQF